MALVRRPINVIRQRCLEVEEATVGEEDRIDAREVDTRGFCIRGQRWMMYSPSRYHRRCIDISTVLYRQAASDSLRWSVIFPKHTPGETNHTSNGI